MQALLFRLAPQGWEESRQGEKTLYSVYFDVKHAALRLADEARRLFPETAVEMDQTQTQDWSLKWREFFTPVASGEKFLVVPPWMADQDPEGLTPIVIEPKMAFGTGHHPTTRLCLDGIAELSRRGLIGPGKTFLDLGTGSGILGLACVTLGMRGLGLDIDPAAVFNAAENRKINRAEALDLAVGGLDCLRPGIKFDLVAANILAEPLISMAGHLAGRVKPGGALLLSGILDNQAEGVVRAYLSLGLDRPELIRDGEWTALKWEFCNPAPGR